MIVLGYLNSSLASHGLTLQGPSSRTTLVGNDGQIISSVAPGGRIFTEETPGSITHTAPYSVPIAARSNFYGGASASSAASYWGNFGSPREPNFYTRTAPALDWNQAYANPAASAWAAPEGFRSAPLDIPVVISGPSGTVSRGAAGWPALGYGGAEIPAVISGPSGRISTGLGVSRSGPSGW